MRFLAMVLLVLLKHKGDCNKVTAMAHKRWHFCSCSYFVIILLKIAPEQTNKLALDCVYHIIVHEMLSRILWLLDQT